VASGAQLSVTDMRQAARHPVDFPVLAEHRRLGDIHMRITNISSNGFMVEGEMPIGRGERVMLRLPEVGRIEAHVIWVAEGRAGLQFERILRPDTFAAMVGNMQPRAKPRLRIRK